MNNWKTAMLGDLVEPADTWNPAKAPSDEVFDYIDLSAVDQEAKLIRGAQKLVGAEAPSRARQLVAKGDVLVSTVRPNLNGVAKVPDELDGATASTGFCVLRARSALLDCGYLFNWVKSPGFIGDMVRKATGASYPAVSDRIIFESKLPLPALVDQRRISDLLDRTEGLRAKRRAALIELDSLTQSIFLDLFGDPRENRSRCKIVPLGELCVKLVDGTHKTPSYTASGVPFITVRNMATGTLSFEGSKFISEDEHAILTRHVHPERGDILVSKDGTIGVACPVETDRDFSIFVSVALLKIKHDIVDQLFLAGQFRTEWIQSQIRAGTKGIAIRHLHLNDFKKLRVLLPALSLQKEFVRRVVAVEKLKTTHRAWLDKMDTLFAVLQHRAFRGEL